MTTNTNHTPDAYRVIAGSYFRRADNAIDDRQIHRARSDAYQRRSEGPSTVVAMCDEVVEGYVIKLAKLGEGEECCAVCDKAHQIATRFEL